MKLLDIPPLTSSFMPTWTGSSLFLSHSVSNSPQRLVSLSLPRVLILQHTLLVEAGLGYARVRVADLLEQTDHYRWTATDCGTVAQDLSTSPIEADF